MSRIPGVFKTRRSNYWLLGIGGFVLLAGLVAVLVVVFSRTGTQGLSKAPVHVTKNVPEKNVAISKDAQQAVKTFLETAVPRKNLAAAWPVSGPAIRQGMTRSQFVAGSIAVVPMFDQVVKATYKTIYSHPTNALIQVGLATKKPGANTIQVALYNATLLKVGSRWTVNGWNLQQVYGSHSSRDS
ncbi:MAG TPA: hypothetical protein VLJ76_01535 [Gaiellaceae bacterium]|nr:hypothetical protein [Gaiellaceae bacterium]